MKKFISLLHYHNCSLAFSSSVRCLLMVLLAVFSSSSVSAMDRQEPIRYSSSGTLQAYVDNNSEYSVTIDDRTFDIIDEGVLVMKNGRPSVLKGLSLPTKVRYEYIYNSIQKNTMSPVVVYIETEPRQ